MHSVQALGYSAANAQAMSAPPYIFACVVTVFSGWAADRYRQRMLSVLLPNLMAMIGFIVIIASVRYEHLTGVTLFGLFLAVGGLYPISPAVTAWTAINLAGSMKRTVSPIIQTFRMGLILTKYSGRHRRHDCILSTRRHHGLEHLHRIAESDLPRRLRHQHLDARTLRHHLAGHLLLHLEANQRKARQHSCG